MKTSKLVIVMALLFCITKSAIGQALSGTSSLHYVLEDADFNCPKCDFTLVYDNMPIKLCGPTKAVLNITNGHIYVDIWSLGPNNGCPINGLGSNTPLKNHVIEIIDDRKLVGDPTYVLNLPISAWSYGVNAIPFRFRPKISNPNVPNNAIVTSQFSLAFSIGPTIGHGAITTRGVTNWTFTPSVFVGPTSTGTTAASTTYPGAAANIAGSQNNFALSYGLLGTFARNNIGLVLAFGFDSAISKNASSYPYQGKPWIGLGVSTSILK